MPIHRTYRGPPTARGATLPKGPARLNPADTVPLLGLVKPGSANRGGSAAAPASGGAGASPGL